MTQKITKKTLKQKIIWHGRFSASNGESHFWRRQAADGEEDLYRELL